jgi:hypothetical protein
MAAPLLEASTPGGAERHGFAVRGLIKPEGVSPEGTITGFMNRLKNFNDKIPRTSVETREVEGGLTLV